LNITSTAAAGVAGPDHQSTHQGAHVMKNFTLITTTLVLCGSFLSIAKAAPHADVPTAVVKVGDLDTTGLAGKKELYRRLSRASRAVCSSLEDQSGSNARIAHLYEACIDQAISGAVAQINRADFTNYVASLTHKPDSTETRLAAR
jgi:UrcA family protein